MAEIKLDGWPYEEARPLLERTLTMHDNLLVGDGINTFGLAGEARRRDGEIAEVRKRSRRHEVLIEAFGGTLLGAVLAVAAYFWTHQPLTQQQVQQMLNQQEQKFEQDEQNQNPKPSYYEDRHGRLHKMEYPTAGLEQPGYESYPNQ